MPPLAPAPTPRARAERVLQSRIVIAVGLALLLVVGAWSTSHGTAEAHATLCLAPGVSQASETAGTAGQVAEVAPADPAAAAACAMAALCCVALVLLFRHLRTRSGIRLRGLLPRVTAPLRAGPRPFLPAVSLIQLSISRT
ncbi:hypothetical protein O5Y58_08630 [Microbacterium paraoxydans]|uniref:hypothetical protein n=1 Tax=Microbacterium paraoxydans TaxID=199592 RepID=UPI00352DF814